MSHFFCFPFPCVSSNEITGSERNTRRGANRGRARSPPKSNRRRRRREGGAVNLAQLIQLVRIGRASRFPRITSYHIFARSPPQKKNKKKTRWQRFSLRPKRENDFSVRGGKKKLAAVGVWPVAVSQRHSPREKKDGLSGMSGGRKRDNSSARGRLRTVVGRRHTVDPQGRKRTFEARNRKLTFLLPSSGVTQSGWAR